MMESAVSHHDVVDIVANMLRQERTTYKRVDYLSTRLPSTVEDEVIDGCWRQRIIEWMYGVVDHCSLRRESVAVATHFLDLVASRGLVRCRRDFQLVAMTSLMLSIKLNDSTSVKLDSMVKLGRGLFDEADVVAMECEMLKVLNWHVHPPTPVCFMRQLLRFLPAETSPIARYVITEITRFISEVSACLYTFIKYDSSTMAVAAILISMERVDEVAFTNEQRERFLDHIFAYTGIDCTSEIVRQAVEDLRSSLDNNVNLHDLMCAMDEQCKRANTCQDSRTKDVEMQFAEPHSPRDVATDILR